MQLFHGDIVDLILIVLLQEGSLSTEQLIAHIARRRKGTTKQGVYRVLRKLAKEEKIVIYKSQVSLNELWREWVSDLFTRSTKNVTFGGITQLSGGEKISFNANTLIHSDQVWSQLFLSIENSLNARYPVYIFNPHNWFIILREETEKLHVRRMRSHKRPIFVTIAGTTALDKQTTRLSKESGFECVLDARIHSDLYIAVIGPYVFETKLSKKAAERIDGIFTRAIAVDEARSLLEDVSDMRLPSRISLERNEKKARAWKKRLAKNFYISKRYRDY